MRYFIKLAYNGTNYHGWQVQPNASSVQETLNNALSVILNSEINVMGAGRTDTGVHAREMYAHFDYDPTLDIESTLHKLNSYLPKDIVIYDIIPVHQEAHARFDAKKKNVSISYFFYKRRFLSGRKLVLPSEFRDRIDESSG